MKEREGPEVVYREYDVREEEVIKGLRQTMERVSEHSFSSHDVKALLWICSHPLTTLISQGRIVLYNCLALSENRCCGFEDVEGPRLERHEQVLSLER